jgi:hypothetical protein
MQNTLQQIDQQVIEDTFISDICCQNWEERKKELKRKEKEFVDEIVKEDPELIKKVRVEYLEQKFDNLNKEYIKRYNEAQEYRNEFPVHDDMEDAEASLCFVYNMFADLIERGQSSSKTVGRPPNVIRVPSLRFLPEIAREIKKTGFDIYVWNNPNVFYENRGGVTEEQIEIAKNANCENFITFKKQDGNRLWTTCTFHKEKTASFCYFKDTNKLHCFGCGFHGSVIDVVQKIYKLDFVNAVYFILNNQ